MASTTNEAENESFSGEIMHGSNSTANNSNGTNIYVSSVNTINTRSSVDSNNKEVLKRRVVQSQNLDGKVKKRKTFVKKFRKEWMDEPIFKGWLQPIPNLSEK